MIYGAPADKCASVYYSTQVTIYSTVLLLLLLSCTDSAASNYACPAPPSLLLYLSNNIFPSYFLYIPRIPPTLSTAFLTVRRINNHGPPPLITTSRAGPHSTNSPAKPTIHNHQPDEVIASPSRPSNGRPLSLRCAQVAGTLPRQPPAKARHNGGGDRHDLTKRASSSPPLTVARSIEARDCQGL